MTTMIITLLYLGIELLTPFLPALMKTIQEKSEPQFNEQCHREDMQVISRSSATSSRQQTSSTSKQHKFGQQDLLVG
jgi:hypothetical protein